MEKVASLSIAPAQTMADPIPNNEKIVMTDLPVLILIAVYTETNRKVLIKLLLKKSGT